MGIFSCHASMGTAMDPPPPDRYAYDCNVLVEKYDHTCPWTGTAIGGGNMAYFIWFVSLLSITIGLLGIMLLWAIVVDYQNEEK